MGTEEFFSEIDYESLGLCKHGNDPDDCPKCEASIIKEEAIRDLEYLGEFEEPQTKDGIVCDYIMNVNDLLLIEPNGYDLDEDYFGLCGYGSGAKAKVFEAKVNPRWREVVSW